MKMSCMLLSFIIWNVIGHVTLRPPEQCPSQCRCDDVTQIAITSCTIDSLRDYSLQKYTISELKVATCDSVDLKEFLASGNHGAIVRMECEQLIHNSNNNNQHNIHENCKQYSQNQSTQNQATIKVCTGNGLQCMAFKCEGVTRRRRAIGPTIVTTKPPSLDGGMTKMPKDNSTSTEMPKKYEKVAMIMIGIISACAVLVNLVVMVKLCLRKRTVIDLFAISLMLFNVMLSLYGIGMVVYLAYPFLRHEVYYCQFFTSIKLFSLGSSVYATLLLIFHRSIENSIDVPGSSEKEIHRHRIFKSIAYVLQGVTFSGLLCVLSWIKLEGWGYLCIIINPRGTVENILSSVECIYYTYTGLAVFWYLSELIYPRCKIFLKKQINILQAMFADDKRKEELLTPYLIREEAYVARDLPIFFIVAITFILWIFGYAITLPEHRWFTHESAAVVRVCMVISPVIIQPLLYLTTRAYNARRVTSKNEKKERLSDVQTECKCDMFYTCPKCAEDTAKNDESNMELVKMQERTPKDEGTLDQSGKETGLANNGNPGTGNALSVPNDDANDENKQLLSQEEKRKKLTKAPKIDISYPSPPPYEGEGGSLGRGEEFGQLISS